MKGESVLVSITTPMKHAAFTLTSSSITCVYLYMGTAEL